MRKQTLVWNLAGFLWTVAAGTALHFVFAWSGESSFAAGFSAVNESTWEHMKLLFFPMFLFSMVELCVQGRNYSNFTAVRALSTALGVALIPVLFYTYTGICGGHRLWADIAVFVLAALGAFSLDFYLLRRGTFSARWMQVAGLAALWALAFLFVYFTFHPPLLPLWRDPVTLGYGLS
ncbi:MAG: DUF6512 family protein [Oscillibacter sp.]